MDVRGGLCDGQAAASSLLILQSYSQSYQQQPAKEQSNLQKTSREFQLLLVETVELAVAAGGLIDMNTHE